MTTPRVYFDPAEVKGMLLDDGYVEILDEPRWRVDLDKWVALANVGGRLALITLNIRIKGEA